MSATGKASGRQHVAFASSNVSRNAFATLGVPGVVIMALRGASTPAAANLAHGRKLYSQTCVDCHGPNGNLIAGHELSTLKARRDRKDDSYLHGAESDTTHLYLVDPATGAASRIKLGGKFKDAHWSFDSADMIVTTDPASSRSKIRLCTAS